MCNVNVIIFWIIIQTPHFKSRSDLNVFVDNSLGVAALTRIVSLWCHGGLITRVDYVYM